MRKLLQLLLLFFLCAPAAIAGKPGNQLSDVLTSGKWVNRSDWLHSGTHLQS